MVVGWIGDDICYLCVEAKVNAFMLEKVSNRDDYRFVMVESCSV